MTGRQQNRVSAGGGSKDGLEGRKIDEPIALARREGGRKAKTGNSCRGFTKINHT